MKNFWQKQILVWTKIWTYLILNFDYCFFYTMLFSRALQKDEKYLWFGLYNPNQIVNIFRIIKSELLRSVIFCVFFDVKGLYWPSYNHRICCKAIAWIICMVNNDHDTINTSKKLKNVEEKVRKEVKWRMEGFVEDANLFIA